MSLLFETTTYIVICVGGKPLRFNKFNNGQPLPHMSLLQPHGKLRRFEGVNSNQPHLRQMSREWNVQHLECTLIMTMNGYGYLKPPPMPMTIAKKKTPLEPTSYTDKWQFFFLDGCKNMLNGTWLFHQASIFSWLLYKDPVIKLTKMSWEPCNWCLWGILNSDPKLFQVSSKTPLLHQTSPSPKSFCWWPKNQAGSHQRWW